MKEKIKKFLGDFLKRFKKNSDPSVKPTRKKLENKFIKEIIDRIKPLLSLYFVAVTIGITISWLGIAFLGYSIHCFYFADKLQTRSHERLIKSNLTYATKELVKQLNQHRILKRNLRRFIKLLNNQDKYGRSHRFSPCKEDIPAFGESPEEGNVVIRKPNICTFEITSYDCQIQPIETKKIYLQKLKKEERNELELIENMHTTKKQKSNLKHKLPLSSKNIKPETDKSTTLNKHTSNNQTSDDKTPLEKKE